MRYCQHKSMIFRNREYTMNLIKKQFKNIRSFRKWERKKKLNFSVCFEVKIKSCKKQPGRAVSFGNRKANLLIHHKLATYFCTLSKQWNLLGPDNWLIDNSKRIWPEPDGTFNFSIHIQCNLKGNIFVSFNTYIDLSSIGTAKLTALLREKLVRSLQRVPSSFLYIL